MTLPGGIQRWLPVVAVSIAVLPAAWLFIRYRKRSLPEVAMVAGTLPWTWMILTPLDRPREVRPWPLRDIADLLAGDGWTAFFQIGGNLLVFAAFGFFAPLRWRIGALAVTGLAAIGSVVVESLQYLLALGRVSSVDDVLLNALGAGLAAAVSIGWRRAARPDQRSPIAGAS